jgi:cation diffusion facilitator CzcD-associated flavoprotein CzcO
MNDAAPLDAIPAETAVVIVGAGFGGLCLAIRLLQAGMHDFVILEKGGEIGGTWRDNTYPGAECDVQSHLYSYSFEGKPDWSRRYAGWEEIQRYLLDLSAKRDLRRYIRFNRRVTGARFDAEAAHWRVTLETGEPVNARHLVLATGPLHVPQIPPLPGLERFAGKVFHSARWDHSFELDGKRVASIGTGASAIQYCPEIAPRVGRLHVFQRTPAWVIPRDTRSYSAAAQRRFARYPFLRRLHRAWIYWRNESHIGPLLHPRLARMFEVYARWLIRREVRDRELARRLTPGYTIGCKRILLSNAWYPMFNRANVELVTEGIAEIREHSVVTRDGIERPVDCIVLGTGFVADPRKYMRDFPVAGLQGHVLADDWKAGAEAYYGITVAGFPNLFQLLGPNTALGHNSVIFMIECQVHYILRCLRQLAERRAASLDVTAAAQVRFNGRLQRAIAGTVWSSGCHSWYMQENGRIFTIWPWSTWRYWLATRRVRAADYRFVPLAQAAISRSMCATALAASAESS